MSRKKPPASQPKKPAILNDEDRKLFAAHMKDVKPLAKSRAAMPLPRAKSVFHQDDSLDDPIDRLDATLKANRQGGRLLSRHHSAPFAHHLHPDTGTPAPDDLTGLDGNLAAKFRKGRVPIDGTLDLHGLTLKEAHPVLDRFLAQAEASGWRCLLIVTGKGMRSGEDGNDYMRGEYGVLRRAVPQWLKQGLNAKRVVAISTAQPKHGGSGAWYVMMRRKRSV